MSLADVIAVGDGQRKQEGRCSPFWSERPAPWGATQCVVWIVSRSCGITRRRRAHVQVHTVHQNVRTARSGVARREYDVAGHLVFDVRVELLHATLLKIQILRLQGAGERLGTGRGSNRDECTALWVRLQEYIFVSTVLWRCRSRVIKRTDADGEQGEVVRFRKVRWILPEPLRALIPGRIVENGIATANCHFLRAERLPGDADARLDRRLVHLDANSAIGTNADGAGTEIGAAGNEELTAGKIEVRLAIVCLRNWRHQRPSDAQVQGHVGTDSPRVFHERTDHFPASAGSCAEEGLVVNAALHLTNQQVGRGVASQTEIDEEAVLEGIGFDVHLLRTDRGSDLDVVLATNHVKRI